MKKHYRQGDVSLHKISKPDLSLLERIELKGRTTLAWGEATGHNHVILDRSETGKYNLHRDKQGRNVLQVIQPVVLGHVQGETEERADHDIHTLKRGWYVQEQEVEYDPFQDAVRKVID